MTAMQKLTNELKRLYLAGPEAEAAGLTRAIALEFRKMPDDGEAGHWERLCRTAHALQSDLGLPAPAVSISGDGAYGLWLSLAQPVEAGQAQEFRALVYSAYCPELAQAGDNAGSVPAPAPALPPCQHPRSGQWAAFINSGMGASFAGDEGLAMQPPEAGQLALLEGLESIGQAAFAHALARLRQTGGGRPASAAPAARPPGVAADGLLLKDATLEDIVNHLHAKNIEPTFRFLKQG
jgi:hypothetical protein